jgi:hypothetical protein
MKKYLMGMVAIVLAISFSAFSPKAKKDKATTALNWFQISGTLSETDAVPRTNTVEYLGHSETAPSIGCSATNYQCVSGFRDDQVSGEELIDDSQVPEMVASKKDN